MATPIFNPPPSSSGTVDLSLYATKAQLSLALNSQSSAISSNITSATSDTAINQKLLTGYASTTGTVSSADTIIAGISKTAGNLSALSATAVSLTGTQTLTNKTFGNLLTANGGASIGGDLSASGIITITKNLTFPIADIRKRVAIFDDGPTPTDLADHRFNGFGKASYTQVYQVKTTAENHVFYSATSATTSNELFRIAGSGAISCAGTLASGSHTITGALTASTTANITGATTVGSLTCSGNATVGGTLGVSGVISTGGLQLLGGTLNYYSEYDMTTTFTGAFTTSNISIKLTRVGRKVSMDIQADYSQSGGSANVLTSSLAIPSAYRPTATSGVARGIHSGTVNSVFAMGNTYVLASGFITITGGSDATNFATTGVNGFQSHSLTWMV